MRIVLFILAGIAFIVSMALLVASQGAIHEIEFLICLLISAVMFSSACIIDAIKTSTDYLIDSIYDCPR